MPQSGAVAETWLVGSQTPGWRAAGALVVLSGLVLDTEVVPVAPDQSNPSNEHIVYQAINVYVNFDPVVWSLPSYRAVHITWDPWMFPDPGPPPMPLIPVGIFNIKTL